MLNSLGARTVYLAFSFVSSLLFALCFTAFTLYRVEKVGLSPLELVLVGTLLELTCFLFEVPTGVLADTRSRRLSVIWGTLLLGPGFMLEGIFPVLAAVLVAQVISVLSLHSQVDALGQMLGGPLLGLLATRASLGVALLVGALLLPALGLYLHPALQQRASKEVEVAPE
ncbi:MAG: hypothetical protein H7095_02225 [Pseudopedobacter sp.]|nr:hypothetical protein [Deinococcales bacterium]